MYRERPHLWYVDTPCIITAVGTAIGPAAVIQNIPDEIRKDGYTRLDVANRFIRANLPIQKSIEYKRGQRPKLKDLHLDGKAIVCVYGHYLYLDHETYWSYFNNENDDVVRIWILKT